MRGVLIAYSRIRREYHLPVSVNDWMSYVRSMFTLSAFSIFLKMIPMNHMETKSFLRHKFRSTTSNVNSCVFVLQHSVGNRQLLKELEAGKPRLLQSKL